MTLDLLKIEANSFLAAAFAQLKKNKVNLKSNWHIDHICYRTSTDSAYETKKNEFSKFSELLIESPVNGRMISTFKLKAPIVFDNYHIDLVELPAPKIGKKTKDGFEHLEVVVDVTFDQLTNDFSQLKFDDSGLKKDFNQELEANLEGLAIKFHQLSLESVIELEKNCKIFKALESSGLLHLMKDYHPLIAGTFPLGVEVESSDIDVLMSGENLAQIAKELRGNFKNFENFSLQMTAANEEPTVIANFDFQGVPFEIFVQRTSSVTQTAYKHFLIEERLLKIGGLNFKSEILMHRKKGLKTEPAFAKALGLTGDPYLELLKLHKESDFEIRQRFFSK